MYRYIQYHFKARIFFKFENNIVEEKNILINYTNKFIRVLYVLECCMYIFVALKRVCVTTSVCIQERTGNSAASSRASRTIPAVSILAPT